MKRGRVERRIIKYRLYIDEVGNSDLGSSNDPNHRYLSLTGVILDLNYIATTVFLAIEALKRDFFDSHPDEPVILHRKELMNKKHPFECLHDPVTETSFNRDMLNLLQIWIILSLPLSLINWSITCDMRYGVLIRITIA